MRCGHARHRGISLIWVAVMLVVLVGLTGLAIDIGHGTLAGQKLQIGADAAALAAVKRLAVTMDPVTFKPVVQTDLSYQAAIDVAYANEAGGEPIQLAPNPENLADGDIVIGRYHRSTKQFVPGLSAPNAVKVVARRTETSLGGSLPLFFGPLFGVDTIDVSRTAIARIGGSTGEGLIVLDPDDPCALSIGGTQTTLWIPDGSVQVNSSHTDALCHSGQPSIYAGAIDVVGGTGKHFEKQVTYDAELTTGADPVPDPWADLPAPSYDPADDLGAVRLSGNGSETVSLSPGYYSGGITMSNNFGRIEMSPGIYVLDGAGLNITGGDFIAEGVLLYIIDTTPNNSTKSNVNLGGNGTIRITAPDPLLHAFAGNDTYAGISIFQARENTNDSKIIGSSKMLLDGAIYFPSNHLDLGGTGGQVGNQLIAKTIEVSGNGTLYIAFASRDPTAGGAVYLVR